MRYNRLKKLIYYDNIRKQWIKYCKTCKELTKAKQVLRQEYKAVTSLVDQIIRNRDKFPSDKRNLILDALFDSPSYKEFQEKWDYLDKVKYKKYGSQGFYFGPWVEISKCDLENHHFKLPIHEVPYYRLKNKSRFKPEYFGKMFIPDKHFTNDLPGIIVGYGYDWGDDYALVKDSTGKVRAHLLNSHWKIKSA